MDPAAEKLLFSVFHPAICDARVINQQQFFLE